MSTVICTASNERYNVLLSRLVASIRDKSESTDVALGILDTGLSETSKQALDGKATHIAAADWDIELSSHAMDQQWFDANRGFQAMTARASLPKYFPGYETYIWIDADCWVQDWSAMDLLARGARDGAICIAPELDRAYSHVYDHGALANWVHDLHVKFHGRETADALYGYPILNCGVFALRGDSPLWAAWHVAMQQAMTNNLDFNADQFSLNKVIYLEDFPRNLLPATCNWLVNKALPKYDKASAMFTEPSLPYTPLGIVHLSWDSKERTHDIEVIGTGETLSTWLQYNPSRT